MGQDPFEGGTEADQCGVENGADTVAVDLRRLRPCGLAGLGEKKNGSHLLQAIGRARRSFQETLGFRDTAFRVTPPVPNLVMVKTLAVRDRRRAWFTLRMTQAAIAPTLRHGVLAVRHGLTQWNADSRWQGWADVPLSDVGLGQAVQAAVALAVLVGSRAPVQVVASDLQRARQTAERLAAALGVDHVEVRGDLRERDVGAWSGLTTDEIESRWPGCLDRWRTGELQTTPAGEHEDVLRTRITRALEELTRKAAAEDSIVVAVTHGGVIRTLDRLYGAVPQPVANVSGRWFHWSDDAVSLGDLVELLPGEDRSSPKGTSL